MAALSFVEELRQQLAHLTTRAGSSERLSLSLSWSELDDMLPDGGLPCGVVELAAPLSLGGGTMVALAAIRAAQKKDPRAWCAWIDPEATLYAPGVVMAEVELQRLFIVRPPKDEVARMAVKVARSQAFKVIVIDSDGVTGVSSKSARRVGWSKEVLVRKLALLTEEAGSTVLLLTDARLVRPAPLPVSLRLELERTQDGLQVRIGKDRYGRGGLTKTVPLLTRPVLQLAG